MMEKIVIRLHLQDMAESEFRNIHAQKIMKNLGIDFSESAPQTLGDCWFFVIKKTDLNKLPSWIDVMEGCDSLDDTGMPISTKQKLNECSDEFENSIYFNRQGKPIELKDWADKWSDSKYRFIKTSSINRRIVVHTIWDGVDMGMPLSLGEKPLIFSTGVWIFNDHLYYEWHWATEVEALEKHEWVINRIKERINQGKESWFSEDETYIRNDEVPTLESFIDEEDSTLNSACEKIKHHLGREDAYKNRKGN